MLHLMADTAWGLVVLKVVETALRQVEEAAEVDRHKMVVMAVMGTLKSGIPYRSKLCL